ncbi:hypothetical protein Tco_1075769, partial [Tanacetum coccineum]
GNEATRCIKVSPLELSFETVMRGLGKMKSLKLLYINKGYGWNYTEGLKFPNALRYLSWHWYPYATFQADNLVGLDMSYSSIVEFPTWGKGKIWSYYGNVKEAILLHNALSRQTKDAG